VSLHYATPVDEPLPKGRPVVGFLGVILYGLLSVMFLFATGNLLRLMLRYPQFWHRDWYLLMIPSLLSGLFVWRTIAALFEFIRGIQRRR
jgi:hypothetical protein